MCRGCISGRRLRLWVALCGAVLAFVLVPAASAGAQPSFSAHRSVEPISVTRLSPNAQTSLLNGAGRTVATQQANSLGGLLFRNVTPGSGYRVRPAGGGAESDPLTVL